MAGLSICSCSLVTAIDVCDRPKPTVHQANRRNEGNQFTSSQHAVVVFPGEGPFVAYTSAASGSMTETNFEVRGTFLDWDGVPQITCDEENGVTYTNPQFELGHTVATAPLSNEDPTIIAYATGTGTTEAYDSELRIAFLRPTGCLNQNYLVDCHCDSARDGDCDLIIPPIDTEKECEIITPPSALAIVNTDPISTPSRFLLLWTSFVSVSSTWESKRYALVVDYASAGPRVIEQKELEPFSGNAGGSAVAALGEQDGRYQFAVIWNEFEGIVVHHVYGVYDHRLDRVIEPFRITGSESSAALDRIVEHDVAIAFDGEHVLALWTQFTDNGKEQIFAIFLTPDGRPLRADPWSPRGGPFRIGSSAIASESSPAITAMESGGFFVAWQESGDPGRLNGIRHVRGLVIDSERRPQFTNPACGRLDFAIDPRQNDEQSRVSVAQGPSDSVVITWTSQSDTDSSAFGSEVRSVVWQRDELLPIEQ